MLEAEDKPKIAQQFPFTEDIFLRNTMETLDGGSPLCGPFGQPRRFWRRDHGKTDRTGVDKWAEAELSYAASCLTVLLLLVLVSPSSSHSNFALSHLSNKQAFSSPFFFCSGKRANNE